MTDVFFLLLTVVLFALLALLVGVLDRRLSTSGEAEHEPATEPAAEPADATTTGAGR